MKKFRFCSIVIVVVFSLVICSFQMLSHYSDKVLSSIADSEILKFCQLVVNASAYNLNDLSEQFLVIERDNDGQIELLDFDMTLATKVATQLVTDLEGLFFSIEEGSFVGTGSIYDSRLKKISDNGGVISSVPLGNLIGNPFLSYIGPNLKIKYQTINRVAGEVVKEVQSYGVNHIMISLEIKVTVYMNVKIPFNEKEYVKEIRYPLILQIMQGDVPGWFQN